MLTAILLLSVAVLAAGFSLDLFFRRAFRAFDWVKAKLTKQP